jgi:hypothetical protein
MITIKKTITDPEGNAEISIIPLEDSLEEMVGKCVDIESARILLRQGCEVNVSNTTYQLSSSTKRHINHCCIIKGCKYGDEDCPVALGEIQQLYPNEASSTLEDLSKGKLEQADLIIVDGSTVKDRYGTYTETGVADYDLYTKVLIINSKNAL